MPTGRHTDRGPHTNQEDTVPTINTSREFRPGRWLALAAAACVAAYVFGLISATPDGTTTAPPSAVCAP